MGRPISSLSELEWEAVCKLYNEGKPLSEIGAEYDISAPTISTIAKRSGLTPRQIRTKTALERASFDPKKLVVEDIDGEPRVVDRLLGEALGYAQAKDIQQLIERQSANLRELGFLPHREEKIGARGRPRKEYWLNLAQINYLITRCGLPRADEWCVQIARVFTAWQTGHLKADSLEVAIELQDGAEAAAAGSPAIANLSDAALDRLMKKYTDPLATKEQLTTWGLELTKIFHQATGRKKLSPETKRQHLETVKRYYNGMCPCCMERRILDEDGSRLRRPDGSIASHYDHATGNHRKIAPHETWLVCAECNLGFETGIDRQTKAPEFTVYQKRRVQMTRQPLLPL